MFTKKIILLAFVAIAAFSSCKKDDSTPDTTALLTSGKWKLTAETTKGVNTFTSKLACEKDDTWTYTADLKGVYDEGATKCSASDPQSTPFTWSLSADQKKLTLIDPSFPIPITGDILELTSSTLKLSIPNPFTPTEITVQTYSK